MLKTFRTLVLVLALGIAGPVLAQADPTLHQIYEAAQAGHLAQAQQMVDQVLRDHPQSAKAHYVAAELHAREGNLPSARQELNTAQRLEPGLPFAKPDSVRELQRELGQGQVLRTSPAFGVPGYARAHSSVPWGWILVLVAAIAVLAAMFRRRASPTVYTQYPGGTAAPVGPPGYGPGYAGPGYGPPGVGSGIAGGLASGLAVGAGVVAGEEIAHHFLDGNRVEGNPYPVNDPQADNPDMGGSDFGVSDGGSWDDGGSVGGDVSGGDDWT
ncbi:MAG TPA: tetratricopeptide repeat protein [Steroidobacteraceae bacterium]|nr:tetratricopeptide repeat protein [Steroidobacteraceae bacterium]